MSLNLMFRVTRRSTGLSLLAAWPPTGQVYQPSLELLRELLNTTLLFGARLVEQERIAEMIRSLASLLRYKPVVDQPGEVREIFLRGTLLVFSPSTDGRGLLVRFQQSDPRAADKFVTEVRTWLNERLSPASQLLLTLHEVLYENVLIVQSTHLNFEPFSNSARSLLAERVRVDYPMGLGWQQLWITPQPGERLTLYEHDEIFVPHGSEVLNRHQEGAWASVGPYSLGLASLGHFRGQTAIRVTAFTDKSLVATARRQ